MNDVTYTYYIILIEAKFCLTCRELPVVAFMENKSAKRTCSKGKQIVAKIIQSRLG